MERRDAVIVGGGQAALSVSHELGLLRVEHVVLERRRVGQTWRDRWDSFCLTPETTPTGIRPATRSWARS
jgi:putative flavoprotein involved in K+ transport